MVDCDARREVGAPALHYVNRLSDFLFVAARIANDDGTNDMLWRPGANRLSERGRHRAKDVLPSLATID